MDYIFFSSLRGSDLERLVVSYDIVCQWHLNLRTRMLQYPHHLHISSSILHVTFLIPKFHLPAHIEECNLLYSFNLTKGVARTDGEAPERGWANINPLAQSTKEMGPGNRRDTIDDFFNDWNWKKIIKFGPSMVKKIQEAARCSREHKEALDELEAVIPKDVVESWTAEVELWETDPAKKNPYQTTSAVRLKLAEEAARTEADRGEIEISHEMHASTIIANGIAIQEEQHKLLLEKEGLGDHPTTTQLYKLTERSNQLRRKIALWIDAQVTVMPEASRHRQSKSQTTTEGTPGVQVYDIELWLPSKLATKNTLVNHQFRLFEWQLRHGQAHDALDEIRNALRLQAYLYKHKDRYASGVKANTRSNTAISRATEMVKEGSRKYRIAREALATLAQTGIEIPVDWASNLRPLRDEDCRKLSEGLVGDTEGRRTVSWIWFHFPAAAEAAEDPRLNDALRIEWCRSRARSMRWTEEVELLQEEMRRIRQFLRWEEDRWMGRAHGKSPADITVREGLTSYALSQGTLRRKLRERFEETWKEVPQMLEFFSQTCSVDTV
ncbi:hypothetical protein H0H93_005344 [Arthromyces matolae]|nr:hypothetical protein H0H93_005344 [Arthromyces matolae]